MIAHAENKMGKVTSNVSVIISDIDKPCIITTEQRIFAEGDNATIECGAIRYNYSSELEWTLNDFRIEQFPEIIVKSYTTTYSYRKALKWGKISKNYTGRYICTTFKRDSGKIAEILRANVRVNDPEKPSIVTSFDKTFYKKSVGDYFTVQCIASGLPIPTLVWYKNNEIFDPRNKGNSSRKDIVISSDNFTITFIYLNETDSGKYECRAKNRIAVSQKIFELVVEGK